MARIKRQRWTTIHRTFAKQQTAIRCLLYAVRVQLGGKKRPQQADKTGLANNKRRASSSSFFLPSSSSRRNNRMGGKKRNKRTCCNRNGKVVQQHTQTHRADVHSLTFYFHFERGGDSHFPVVNFFLPRTVSSFFCVHNENSRR